MGRARFASRIMQFADIESRNLDITALALVTDIKRGADILAPKLTRALVNSGHIERVGSAHYRVIYGGNQVPYARRRHFENKSHPATLRYLQRSGEAVARGGLAKYLRRAV